MEILKLNKGDIIVSNDTFKEIIIGNKSKFTYKTSNIQLSIISNETNKVVYSFEFGDFMIENEVVTSNNINRLAAKIFGNIIFNRNNYVNVYATCESVLNNNINDLDELAMYMIYKDKDVDCKQKPIKLVYVYLDEDNNKKAILVKSFK